MATGFDPPIGIDTTEFVLRPLGVEHNEADYEAWTSSIDHIRATPGFEHRSWPHEMTLEENARDLAKHADDFENRRGFTYTVLSREGQVIGCLYIYPRREGPGADVRSWVRVSHADLDGLLHHTVTQWLRDAWPFDEIVYADRG